MSRGHKSTLPSLSKNLQLSNDIGSDAFAKSLPVYDRKFEGLFGNDSFTFSRKDLRTPPEIRNNLNLMKGSHVRRVQRIDEVSKSMVDAFEEKRRKLREKKEEEEEIMLKRAQMERSKSVLAAKKIVPEGLIGLPFDEKTYVGEDAKREFFDLFKHANRDFAVYEDDQLPEEKQTPRSLYLREVERRSLPPLTLVLRKDGKTNGVFLANRGLGDLHMAPLIHTIDTLPNVDTIDLNDNRLTDETLMPLMLKLSSMKTLTHLDLSYNKIDDSSEVIMEYIRSEECCLKALILNGADVDDTEAGNLAEAISHNHSLLTLSLAHNLLGKDESKLVTNPDLVTGGTAIGQMLEVNKTITKLDLSWNAIRGSSGEKLATSLKKNSTLEELRIGHNGFGDNATSIVGRSLKTNTSMTVLDVSYNSLTPISVAVLANSLVFNEKLQNINLDGNILGKVGTQAMVAAIQRASGGVRQLKITFNDCDCRKVEPGLFDPANPAGTHLLDLSVPYGVMVVDECIYLANYRAGVTLVKLEYSNGGPFQRVPLVIEQQGNGKFSLTEFKQTCRKVAGLIMEGTTKIKDAADMLCKLLRMFDFKMQRPAGIKVCNMVRKNWTAKEAKNAKKILFAAPEELHEVLLFEIFFALFILYDDDCSGTVEVHEFINIVETLGMSMTVEAATRLMNEFDKDHSGTIDANEFSSLLVNEFCRTEAPRGHLVDQATNKPWVVPHTGKARVEIECVCDAPSVFDVGEDSGTTSVIKAMREAKTEEQRRLIFEQAVMSPYHFMTEQQGQLLLDELCGPPAQRVTKNQKIFETIGAILPQLVSAEHCCKFINNNLNDAGKLSLRLQLGPMFNALTGSATGHYVFDFRRDVDMMMCRKLAAIATTETKYCKNMGCNTSQHGDWSHFRNEQLNEANIRISPQWIASYAGSGKLRVDFVSTARPNKSIKAIHTNRFEKIINKLGLQEIIPRFMALEAALQLEKDREGETVKPKSAGTNKRAQNKASRQKSMLAKQNSSNLLAQSKGGGQDESSPRSRGMSTDDNTSPRDSNDDFDNEGGGSLRMSSLVTGDLDNGNDPVPAVSFSIANTSESIVQMAQSPQPPSHVSANFTDDIQEPFTLLHVRENYTEWAESSHLILDVLPPERPREQTTANFDEATGRPITPPVMKRGTKPDTKTFPRIYPFAYRKIVLLECALLGVFISVEQAIQILECFPPDVAYLRVSLFSSLFSRIVDLDNLRFILDDVFTENERLEALHRIGIMNLYDPLYPDRYCRLDLRRWDHREWCKVLIFLAITEPGDNWEDADYRWGKYDDHVPGWELPQTWTEPDELHGGTGGPRNFGWLRVTYTTTGPGCAPNMNSRRALRKRCLPGMKTLF